MLVLNAAYQKNREGLEKTPTEEIERVFDTNLYAPLWTTRAAIPHLKAGASIIVTSSIQAFNPSPELFDYAMTKAAQVAFTKALAQQLGQRGIRVNAVAPGPIWTPLIPATEWPDKLPEFGQDTPLGRAGQPAELAPAFVFLASPECELRFGCRDSGHGRQGTLGRPLHRNHDITDEIAAAVHGNGLTVAAAESITAGQVATALAAAGDASEWFGASIVAYETAMKRKILGVHSASVISEDCARQMAEGALLLTGADLVVATTGVGGPDPEEGMPPGTVIICAGTRDDLRVFEHALPGSPEEVVDLATQRALEHLRDAALASVGGVR